MNRTYTARGKGEEVMNEVEYDDNALRSHLVAFFSFHKPEKLVNELDVGNLVRWCRKKGITKLNERLLAKYDDQIDMKRSLGSSRNKVLHFCKGVTPDLYPRLCRRISRNARVKDFKLQKDVKSFFKSYHQDLICPTLFQWTDLMGRSRSEKVLKRLYSKKLQDMAEIDAIFKSDSEESASTLEFSPRRKKRTPNHIARERAKRRNHRFKDKLGLQSDKPELKSSSFQLTEPIPSETSQRRSYVNSLYGFESSHRNFSPRKGQGVNYEEDTFDRREKESILSFRTKKLNIKKTESNFETATQVSSVAETVVTTTVTSRRKPVTKQKSNVRRAFNKVAKVFKRENSNFDLGLKRVDDIEKENPEVIPMSEISESTNITRPPLPSAAPGGLMTFEDRKRFILGDSPDTHDSSPRKSSKFALPFRSLRKPREVQGVCDEFVLCEDVTHDYYKKCVTCGFKRNLHSGESVGDESEEEDTIACSRFKGKGAKCENCGFPVIEHKWYAFDVPPSLLASKRKKGKT